MELFAVNGRVDAEQLDALLAAEAEYPALDYKSACDLSDRRGRGRAEFVKDSAAMMSLPSGGYLVIGADGHGRPVGASLDESMYDSANLTSILVKYLEGDVSLVSQIHHLEQGDVAVIYIARRADHLFPIVKTDVVYVEHGKETIHLRTGDVIVRDGTSSRRWRSADLPALLKPYANSIRDQEKARIGELLEEVRIHQRGQNLAAGPIGTITWHLPSAEFDTAIAELCRAGDTKALRVLYLSLQSDGLRLAAAATKAGVDSTEMSDLLELLDRAASVAAVGVTLGDESVVEGGVQALHRIYLSLGHDGTPLDDTMPRIWLEIAARVLGVMALAIRLEEWRAIPQLTLRAVGTGYVFRSWLRHADVWASRTDQSQKITDKKLRGFLVAVARQCVARVPAMRPDLPEDSAPPLDAAPEPSDQILDSVCQADFLWCVVAAAGGRGIGEQYPSFAALYDHRTRPMVDRLLSDRTVAAFLLPEVSQVQLKEIVNAILEMASQASHWW